MNRNSCSSIGHNYKQLLDEVFVTSGIIKVEVSVISRSRRLRLITLTETLIIPDIPKAESNNCFIIHCFEENNDKHIIAAITVYFQTLKNVQLSDFHRLYKTIKCRKVKCTSKESIIEENCR